jgi:hypothetical protein
MPFRFQPPPPRPFYRNPYVGTLAELAGAPQQIEAQRVLRDSAIHGQMAEQIGAIGTNTLDALMRYRADQPRRELLAAQAEHARIETATARRGQQEDQAIRTAMVNNGGDVESALAELRTSGDIGVTAATKLQKQITDARMSDLRTQDETLKATQAKLTQASQFLRGVEDRPEEERADAYTQIVPHVRAIVGPDLGKMLPDEYDPSVVGQAITWGETAQQTLERRRAALEAARQAQVSAKNDRDKDEYYTKSLGNWLSTVESQDEWDAALKFAKEQGAPDITLQKFGTEFSDEAKTRAEQLGMTPAERASARRTDNAPTRTRQVVITNPDGSTTTKIVEDTPGQSFYSPPPAATPPAVTPAQRATAERWKANELQKLEERFRAQQPNSPGAAEKGVLTEDDLNQAKWQIDNGYRAQIGLPNRSYEAFAAAMTGAGGGRTPAAAPPAAPPRRAAGPDAARRLLQGKQPGKYKLSDGSVWIIGRDGSIAPGM